MKFIAAWPYGLGGLSLSAKTVLGMRITAYAPGAQTVLGMCITAYAPGAHTGVLH